MFYASVGILNLNFLEYRSLKETIIWSESWTSWGINMYPNMFQFCVINAHAWSKVGLKNLSGLNLLRYLLANLSVFQGQHSIAWMFVYLFFEIASSLLEQKPKSPKHPTSSKCYLLITSILIGLHVFLYFWCMRPGQNRLPWRYPKPSYRLQWGKSPICWLVVTSLFSLTVVQIVSKSIQNTNKGHGCEN